MKVRDVQKVSANEKSTTQDSIADKKTAYSSKCCMLEQEDNKKNKRIDRCRFCGSNTVPPECIECVIEVDFSLALSQVS